MIIRFLTLLSLSLAGGFVPAHTQQLPTPNHSTSEWIVKEVYPKLRSQMPVQRMGSPADGMPAAAIRQSPVSPTTGKYGLYYNPKTGISYNLEYGLMTDVFSGRVYRFYKRGTTPIPLPDSFTE